MPITLGSNIASLRGQRSLNKATNELRSVYERLSSGQRINRASDDTAGLAVSESLKADTRIFTQGIRNVNDGISLLSIADSALENLSTIVTRLQELAEQASNGVYGTKQREALDAEAQTLAKEFTRIQQSTTFNGISLLNGSLSNLQIQAGIGDSAILDLGVGGKIGTGTFENPINVTTAGNGDENKLLDLNQDGIQDLITIIATSDIIEVKFGVGDGSFSNTTNYSINANSTDYNIADFNNDGYYDLVTGNGTSNSIDIRLGNSDGTFGSATTFATGSQTNELAIGDINNDGFLDIVASNRNLGATAVNVLTGNGNGTFTTQSSVNIGANAGHLVLEDFNNDGNLDIAAMRNSGTDFYITSGNGDGTFSSSITNIPTGVASSNELLAGDLNNDGLMDLVIGNRNTGAKIYLNQGGGTFDAGTNYSTGSANNGDITLGDFNGDGFLDLGVGSTTGLRVGINQGNGTFGTASVYDSTASLGADLAVGDANNDGVLDIITSITSAAGGKVFLGTTTDGTSPINPFSLKTMADAKQALTQFKNKSNLLSIQRGEIGAYQSRLSTANNVISSAKENVETAESRIRDADIAEESSKLVRNRILQQASSSILAQANLQPELALRLLS
jgi:flagellin-like hook-associated protein FlgL